VKKVGHPPGGAFLCEKSWKPWRGIAKRPVPPPIVFPARVLGLARKLVHVLYRKGALNLNKTARVAYHLDSLAGCVLPRTPPPPPAPHALVCEPYFARRPPGIAFKRNRYPRT